MSKSYWSDLARQLTPYVPGEQPSGQDLLKLNTNENPYGPSQRVLEAISGQLGETLRLYPPPDADSLKETIASYYGLEKNQVFVGNGSDEVLAHIFCALLKHDKPVLFPDITYSFYPVYCGLYGIDYQTIPLRDDFTIEPADYGQENSGIIFPNPNAPTGRLLALDAIKTLLDESCDSVVVIDEAYIDFGGESAVELVKQYHNLVVVQTVSKSRALAGLRVGFALADKGLIEALERVKNSFNSYPLDRLAIAGAVAAFEDEDYFQACCEKIIASRQTLTEALKIRGFEILPSSANFLFARHHSFAGVDLATALREKDVLIRHFNRDRISNFLRITVGNEEQNMGFIKALDEVLNAFLVANGG